MIVFVNKESSLIEYAVLDTIITSFDENGCLKLDNQNKVVMYIKLDTHNELSIESFPDEFYSERFIYDNGVITENPLWVKPVNEKIKELEDVIDILLIESLGV